MRPSRMPLRVFAPVVLGALLALPPAACVHGTSAPVEIKTESLGKPGLVLARALTGVQALGYTVTVVESEATRFHATHGGSTFASLFGSDSNCEMDVRATPAAAPNASEITLTWRARNPGSLAGCRKDAEHVLRNATGRERPLAKKSAPAYVDPKKVLRGGTYGN
ncbi:MAG: hypothetical protein ACE5FC_09150 [Myxococcota bacterium]